MSAKRLVQVTTIVVLSLAAAACGSDQPLSGEAAVNATASNETASNDGVLAGPEFSVGDDGAQYGDNLDEFFDAEGAAVAAQAEVKASGVFEEIEWDDLIPPGQANSDARAELDHQLQTVVPGSPEADALYEEAQAALNSDEINPELDGTPIVLSGFVAPLTYVDERVTEFLLVPYFGACIHVPPPPPNQTIMITLAEGQSLSVEEAWGAVWVAGTMTATSTDTDLASASYSISEAQTGVQYRTS